MTRKDKGAWIEPLPEGSVPELDPIVSDFKRKSRFRPNHVMVMARRPKVVYARRVMATALRYLDLDRRLSDAIFLVASFTSDGRYDQAHRTSGMLRRGADIEFLRALPEFETSPLVSEAERAALRLARDSALVPNGVTEEHFTALRKFYTEDEIIDIVTVSCAAAWSNRWSETLAIELEQRPLVAMKSTFPNWDPGNHVR